MNQKKSIEIPLGSQHISLLEPVRFRFTCENETIVGVQSDVGFVHRGVERACQTHFSFDQVGYVVARICGLCAITHSVTYTASVESLMEGEVPKRATYLRTLLLELDRIHSHLLCLAHVCENAGYEAMFMRIMGDREPIMDLQERITGNRVQFDYVSIGGVNRDIDTQTASLILRTLDELKPKIEEYLEEFASNWSLSLKYRGIGALTYDEALRYNAVGPLARASGLATDIRTATPYLPYEALGFEMVTGASGDIMARNQLRLKEIEHSITLCERIIEGLPSGPIMAKIKGKPQGEALLRYEAPRGELMYYIKASGKPILDRVRIKTPTFSCIPAMMHIFKAEQYADAPAILASFDPCLSCTAK
jgi:ech hydrogenase subunit E